MISFANDYSEGAHFNILKRLVDSDVEQADGYFHDQFCEEARERIKAAIGSAQGEVDVEFIAGGTQTNMIVIDSTLKNYEGVIAAKTGHIATHEAGAIEHAGHKVIELPHHSGKLSPGEVLQYVTDFYQHEAKDHEVHPGMVYISHPTEFGTLYTKAELKALRSICDQFNLKLFMDGARLGYAFGAASNELSIQDIAELCDVFYIGGTKVGALIGEALVFMRGCKAEHFETLIKQKGALLAKGRIIGVQFAELFKDNLYFEIGKYAVEQAERIKAALVQKGYRLVVDSPTNQQFVVMSNEKYDELSQEFKLTKWEPLGANNSIVRICTSWATKPENVEKLIAAL